MMTYRIIPNHYGANSQL